jgi:hypothetical protein
MTRDDEQIAVLERILARCVRREDGCLVWTGYTSPTGYGQVGVKGKVWNVHRLVFTIRHGDIPERMCVCHSCDVPACVEDTHHWLGTQSQNIADSRRKGRIASGGRSGTAKLTEDQVRAIKQRHALGESGSALAREYDVSPTTVGPLLRGKTWRNVDV